MKPWILERRSRRGVVGFKVDRCRTLDMWQGPWRVIPHWTGAGTGSENRCHDIETGHQSRRTVKEGPDAEIRETAKRLANEPLTVDDLLHVLAGPDEVAMGIGALSFTLYRKEMGWMLRTDFPEEWTLPCRIEKYWVDDDGTRMLTLCVPLSSGP